ncbi:MAG: hypothetical protein ABSH56_19095 [Bryobacteraceae bacterium]|jgi:hypothetical protein
MVDQEELLAAEVRRKAGHYEVLGETYAKFEFFEHGWNSYSRFLDVDKVDLILRRKVSGRINYREVQVKFGKLYEVGPAWERRLFDFTSWRFFKEDEFAGHLEQNEFFIAYVLARDIGYRGDIFIFPVRDFAEIIRSGIPSKGQRKVYISRLHGAAERWVLRRATHFTAVTDESCLDVSRYRRDFAALLQA